MFVEFRWIGSVIVIIEIWLSVLVLFRRCMLIGIIVFSGLFGGCLKSVCIVLVMVVRLMLLSVLLLWCVVLSLLCVVW